MHRELAAILGDPIRGACHNSDMLGEGIHALEYVAIHSGDADLFVAALDRLGHIRSCQICTVVFGVSRRRVVM